MRTNGVPHSNWKELYSRAMLQTNETKMRRQVDDARNAVLDRIEEILTKPASDEHKSLNDALRFLQVLQNEISAKQKSA